MVIISNSVMCFAHVNERIITENRKKCYHSNNFMNHVKIFEFRIDQIIYIIYYYFYRMPAHESLTTLIQTQNVVILNEL